MILGIILRLTVIAPLVEEALWPSLEELVSVEKPESCTTLPLLFSPLFGSFLPLCELLRLRVSDEDDASAPDEGAAADADDVDGSLCDNFRFMRIPGSHSQLIVRFRTAQAICCYGHLFVEGDRKIMI